MPEPTTYTVGSNCILQKHSRTDLVLRGWNDPSTVLTSTLSQRCRFSFLFYYLYQHKYAHTHIYWLLKLIKIKQSKLFSFKLFFHFHRGTFHSCERITSSWMMTEMQCADTLRLCYIFHRVWKYQTGTVAWLKTQIQKPVCSFYPEIHFCLVIWVLASTYISLFIYCNALSQ